MTTSMRFLERNASQRELALNRPLGRSGNRAAQWGGLFTFWLIRLSVREWGCKVWL